jgi:hypothetical protein
MSDQTGEGTTGAVGRWLSGLSGPQLESQPDNLTAGSNEQPATLDYNDERDRYDEDFDYYWGDWKVPLWIALIMQVPWRQRLDIFVIGFIVGLVIAGVAMSWGLLLSRY